MCVIKFSSLCVSLSGLVSVCIVLDCYLCWNLPSGLLKDCYFSSSSLCVCCYHTNRDNIILHNLQINININISMIILLRTPVFFLILDSLFIYLLIQHVSFYDLVEFQMLSFSTA